MNDSEIKDRIILEVYKTVNLFNSLLGERRSIDFSSIEIRFSLRGKTAGTATFYDETKKILNFNMILARDNFDDFIDRTVDHEVAHIYEQEFFTTKENHGETWKNLMILIGKNPEQYHHYSLNSIASFSNKGKVLCEKCGNEFYISNTIMEKITTGLKYHHKNCGGSLSQILR